MPSTNLALAEAGGLDPGDEPDDNANSVPDSCEFARGDLDLDGDGVIGAPDLGILLANWDC